MSTFSSFDLNMLWSVFGLLIQLAIFGVCVYYIVQKQTIDGYLLGAGSLIHLLTSLFYTVGIPVLSGMNVDIYSNRAIFSVAGFINLIGTVCFSIGFIILVFNHLKVANNQPINFEE